MVSVNSIEVPSLIGKTVRESVIELSNLGLNARVLYQKEEADIKEGTILHQVPYGGQTVKQNQSVFITISKLPEVPKAPYVLGSQIDAISDLKAQFNFRIKKFSVSSDRPPGEIIAQWPSPGKELEPKTLITYISSKNNLFFVFPDMRGKSFDEVQQFLEAINSTFEIGNQPIDVTKSKQNYVAQNNFVRAHKPLPGSLVNLSNPIHVRLSLTK